MSLSPHISSLESPFFPNGTISISGKINEVHYKYGNLSWSARQKGLPWTAAGLIFLGPNVAGLA